jgi:tripartite-type tricarboxylate transporter receptor subunit TctC
MIIPFAPGGASDFVGRILQPNLSELLGQQVVIENRPGASGNIGVEAAARSAPDGYTLLLGNVGSIAINPGVFPKLAADPLKDLVAVTQVVDVPGVLVAHPGFPPNSVKEFVAYAKANPGKLNYASPAAAARTGSRWRSCASCRGLDMVHVPYKGGAGRPSRRWSRARRTSCSSPPPRRCRCQGRAPESARGQPPKRMRAAAQTCRR